MESEKRYETEVSLEKGFVSEFSIHCQFLNTKTSLMPKLVRDQLILKCFSNVDMSV